MAINLDSSKFFRGWLEGGLDTQIFKGPYPSSLGHSFLYYQVSLSVCLGSDQAQHGQEAAHSSYSRQGFGRGEKE